MAQFWTNRSQSFRNAAALAGIPACLLLMLFGLVQLAGLGALLAPVLGLMVSIWLLLAVLAFLLGLLAEFAENWQQLVFGLLSVRLQMAACCLLSFSPSHPTPPPRAAS